MNGGDVEWENWRFHFGLDPREGLVLHRVRYVDGGKERSVLYRASLSEMVVPYGDADPNWAWRSAFDVGEYGIGQRFSDRIDHCVATVKGCQFSAHRDDIGPNYPCARQPRKLGITLADKP